MDIFEQALSQTSRKPNSLGGVVERRRQKRVPTLRSSHSSLTSHLWELELVPAFGLTRLTTDIDSLVVRSIDRNIFFESQALQSAWPRLTSLLAPRGAWMLCLWETIGEQRSLRLFMPVQRQKAGFPRKNILRSLSNHYMPLGTPLVCNECAEDAVETLLRLLADPALGLPMIFEFPHLRKAEKTIELIKAAASRLGLKSIESGTHERAALFAPTIEASDRSNGTALNKKRLRELARQQRKLAENGKVTFERASSQEAILDAFENFLTLELKGWKGRYGTALYNLKKITAFSRQMAANLATIGGCEIYSMKQNGKTIAALILLGRDGDLVPWKMAFEENLSAYSPGMQLMQHVTNTVISRKSFKQADSLAVPDHWMMNRIWSDRITITDLSIALTQEAEETLEYYVNAKFRMERAKSFAKTVVKKIMPGWKK